MANPNRNDKDLMINVTTNYKGVSSDKVFDIAVMSLFLKTDRVPFVRKGLSYGRGWVMANDDNKNNPTLTI